VQIEQQIPKRAENGALTIEDDRSPFGVEVPIKVGHLDPVDEVSGQRARLNNLGYNAGERAAPAELQFRSAVEEFQCDYDLTVDGVCGPQTQAKLLEVHGC
jgi:peptidoglycan hydrolase-like protein with peptidoglycan-binding domain